MDVFVVDRRSVQGIESPGQRHATDHSNIDVGISQNLFDGPGEELVSHHRGQIEWVAHLDQLGHAGLIEHPQQVAARMNELLTKALG